MDHKGQTALFNAMKNKYECYHQLLEFGGERLARMPDHNGQTVLHYICVLFEFDSLAIPTLIEFGGEKLVFAMDYRGHTALHDATNSSAKVSQLLDTGGEKLALMKTRDGFTALHFAFFDESHETILLLLRFGGEKLVLSRDRGDGTAPHLCGAMGWLGTHYPHTFHHVLALGGTRLASINTPLAGTLLHLVCSEGHGYHLPNAAVIQKVLEIGGERLLVVCNDRGNTALHNACEFDLERETELDVKERNYLLSESIQQLLDVGREGILRIRNHSNLTASDIYAGRVDRSQEIVDRFMEIGYEELVLGID